VAKAKAIQVTPSPASLFELWANLDKITAAVPTKVMYLVDDWAILHGMSSGETRAVKYIPKCGPVDSRLLMELGTAIMSGFRIIVVLRGPKWIGWAIRVRQSFPTGVAFVSLRAFDLYGSKQAWVEAPAPFKGWSYFPPERAEDVTKGPDARAERLPGNVESGKLAELLDGLQEAETFLLREPPTGENVG